MRVTKWGNSLAVRIPNAVAATLKLKPGDEVEIVASRARQFSLGRNRNVERALEQLRALRTRLPKGFRFDRDEANSR